LRRDLDPTAGCVYLDGVPLPRYNLSSVLAHIGVILQRPEILSSNVRENLLLSVPAKRVAEIKDEDIWNMIDLVSPDLRARFNGHGLDTLVGRQGLELSGGEQQRLCVIRALIKNPAFLIIDEATSSLDSETERDVQNGIDIVLSQGRSALVIAHRYSTIQNCDTFIVIKKQSECDVDEPQVEAICDSLEELYEFSPTFRHHAELQGFRF
jgi:ABC-type multidrug transport system fused ATPase/permease subunit